MNSRERFLAVLAGDSPDMVPIAPVLDGYYAPKVAGRINAECWVEPGCMSGALSLALERFGYDACVAEAGLGPHPSVLGCPVEVEGNDVPLVVDTLIAGREDLTRIAAPDPWADGKLEPVRQLVAACAGEAAVIGTVRSPFEFAATIRGLMDFMGDFYRDPQLVSDLVAACLPVTIATGHALAEAGVDAIVMKDSFASCSMISPDHYRQFAFEAERDAIAALQEVPVILHICRNSMPILPLMAQTGAAALEIDSPVDLAQAREAVGDTMALKGNIDAVTVIEKGTPAEVDAAVEAAMQAAKGQGPFILSTGDSIPLSAPEENISALVEAGRRHGSFS